MTLAQISDKATDPGAWEPLVKTLGVGGFFGLVLLLLASAFMFYVARALVGGNGILRTLAADVGKRAIAFLDEMQASIKRIEDGCAELRGHVLNVERDVEEEKGKR